MMNSINYEEIDVLMRPIIEILNKYGVTTKFCCQGHKDYDQVYIMFDESIDFASLEFLLDLFDSNNPYCQYNLDRWGLEPFSNRNQFTLTCWARYGMENTLTKDWSLEIANVLDSQREEILVEVFQRLELFFTELEGKMG